LKLKRCVNPIAPEGGRREKEEGGRRGNKISIMRLVHASPDCPDLGSALLIVDGGNLG
jgi:hypothetical protein